MTRISMFMPCTQLEYSEVVAVVVLVVVLVVAVADGDHSVHGHVHGHDLLQLSRD